MARNIMTLEERLNIICLALVQENISTESCSSPSLPNDFLSSTIVCCSTCKKHTKFVFHSTQTLMYDGKSLLGTPVDRIRNNDVHYAGCLMAETYQISCAIRKGELFSVIAQILNLCENAAQYITQDSRVPSLTTGKPVIIVSPEQVKDHIIQVKQTLCHLLGQNCHWHELL